MGSLINCNKIKNENELIIKNNNHNLNFELMRSDKIYPYLRKIKEIKGNRILLLYDEFFEIFDLKTSKKICRIKENFKSEYPRYYDNLYQDFIELINKDLILWSSGKIFYYNNFDNNYKLSQTINELSQQKNIKELCQIGYVEMYDLYNIIQLDNSTLISCNSLGLKLYNFVEKGLKFIKVIPMFLDV